MSTSKEEINATSSGGGAAIPVAGLLDLTGKSAVVTGGAAGIGFGIARRLGEAGARVAVADVNAAAAERAAARLRELGSAAQAVTADVRSTTDVRWLMERVVGAHGGVDILVNNAGIFPLRPTMALGEEEWDRVLDVNLKGAFLCAQAAAQHMIAQGTGGVILNIASIDSLHPSAVGLAAYDASKGGLLMLTKNLALELAPRGIRVLALAPGGITTEGTQAQSEQVRGSGIDLEEMARRFLARIPLGRMGEPDDIGRVALFLVSDAAAYMTGTLVVVDGGVLLS
jgi:2-dehydro-3-deoxy-D-gluconate 5-dehydrogenase